MIYTSGSTGIPKGVVVAHESLANKMVALKNDFDVGPDFRAALFIPSAFDASIEQALLPLVGGGAVVVISDEARESAAQFWSEIEPTQVTFVSCVPSYLESIVRNAPRYSGLAASSAGWRSLHTGVHEQDFASSQGVADYQSLWSDRNDNRCNFFRGLDRSSWPTNPDWSSDVQLSGLCSGRWLVACSCGGCG